MANPKFLIELKVEQNPDKSLMVHYTVPNYSGTKTKQVNGTINVSNITRALDRISWIIQYLKNPVSGKSIHEVMSINATRQEAQNKTQENDS